MPFARLILSIFTFTLLSTEVSFAQSPESVFANGLASLQKSDWAGARQSFQTLLESHPHDPSVLYNLGLVEYRSGARGLGVSLWRTALGFDPSYGPARSALQWGLEKLNPPRIPSHASFWLGFQQEFLARVLLSQVLFLILIFLLPSGWILLRYIGSQRRARLDETPAPTFPIIGYILAAGVILSVALAGSKVLELTDTWATVIIDKATVRSGPATNATPLFDLFEGHEVFVRQSNEDWLQVTYPGGLTGWTEKKGIVITRPGIGQ